ncbi:MAG: hypothetical protein MI974_01970 [Chitinophagales bacterium]|nr:hypothetical protein [Chitinophagales bacterium]
MKLLKYFFTISIIIAAFSCNNGNNTDAEAQAEAEVLKLDSINQLIETSIDEVNSDAQELEAALDSLDELFPEEE